MSTPIVVDASDIQAQVNAAADAARPVEAVEPDATPATPEPAAEPQPAKEDAAPALSDKERIAQEKVEARLAEITRQKHEAQREAEHYKKLHEQAKQAQEQREQNANTPQPPKPDEYPTYDDYIEALTEYKADALIQKRLNERDAQQRDEVQRREAHAQQDAALKAWTAREEKVLSTLPDYKDVMKAAENIEIPHHLVQIIFQSDIGPQVAYHLAKNPDLTGEISALDPLSAARAIGRLERQLQDDHTDKPTPVPSAPHPLPKLRGASGARVEKHPDDMNQREFNAWRAKQHGSG